MGLINCLCSLNLFYFILFYLILFYSILLYFILFCFVLLHFFKVVLLNHTHKIINFVDVEGMVRQSRNETLSHVSDSYLEKPLVELKTVITKVPGGVKDNEKIEKGMKF